MKRIRSAALALALAVSLLPPAPARGTLIGDTINVTSGFGITPHTATIGAGVEFVGIFGVLNLDFGADTLSLTTNGVSVGWSGYTSYVFSDFGPGLTITDMSVLSNTGFSGPLVTAFSFTDTSITLNVSSAAYSPGAVLVYGLTFQTIPSPHSLALFGAGFVALSFVRRRRRT
jgi:hypothetical protein